MHYYEFNIGDYRRRTTHLTPIEHYIYRTLLDWYFLDEKPLKADMDYLLRILGLPKRNSLQLQNVLQDFFVEIDGVYHNKRADEMLAKYKAKHETNSENGKKGGRPPKKADENQAVIQDSTKPSTSDVKPTENPTETETKPNEKATNNHKPITNKDNINKNILSAQAQEIFEYWKNVFGKNASTQFSDKRKAKVTARLKDGYSIDEIKKAIYNVSQNEFNVVNEYTDLELICRDIEHLERYRDLTPRKQAEMNFTGANHATHQSNSVTEYRDTLQQQYDEYWLQRAEQGTNRPDIIDVY